MRVKEPIREQIRERIVRTKETCESTADAGGQVRKHAVHFKGKWFGQVYSRSVFTS